MKEVEVRENLGSKMVELGLNVDLKSGTRKVIFLNFRTGNKVSTSMKNMKKTWDYSQVFLLHGSRILNFSHVKHVLSLLKRFFTLRGLFSGVLPLE